MPPGFLVATEAYRAFVGANGISAQILAPARQIRPEDPRALEPASAGIRDIFQGGSIPPEVAAEIADADRDWAGAGPRRRHALASISSACLP